LGELTNPRTACQGRILLIRDRGEPYRVWDGPRYNPASREEFAFLPQADRLGFVDSLSTFDNLRLFSGLSRRAARTAVDRLADRFHLPELPAHLDRASGGEKMRLSAIRGLLPRHGRQAMPLVVIADEPTAGLDPRAARALADELIELARAGGSIVIVITHDPRLFVGDLPETGESPAEKVAVQILECDPGETPLHPIRPLGELTLRAAPEPRDAFKNLRQPFLAFLQTLGGIVLAPIAFVWGLIGLRWPAAMLRLTLLDALGPGTHLFSLIGCSLVAGTVAYFIFEQTPKPQLVEPLLLPEILEATGHTLVRVVLPLGACALVATKLGAAQAARLSSAVRAGLLDTLALGRWRIESYALVPAVLAQILCMALATAAAVIVGLTLAALVYTAGHEQASLALALDLMRSGLSRAERWPSFLAAKVVLSGFLAGTVAALFGHAPAVSEDDVGRAVHRTLLWGVLCVIACQCGLMIAEFMRR
jgi:hypothetical protein